MQAVIFGWGNYGKALKRGLEKYLFAWEKEQCSKVLKSNYLKWEFPKKK